MLIWLLVGVALQVLPCLFQAISWGLKTQRYVVMAVCARLKGDLRPICERADDWFRVWLSGHKNARLQVSDLP